MRIQTSSLVGGRLDLALLANDRNYKVAIEIGTDKGVFARDFLDRWRGEMLYCIDPYCRYEAMPWVRDGDLLCAMIALAPHNRRFRLIQATSHDAASYFDGRLLPSAVDFIYVDGAHDQTSVYQDLTLWWDRVRPGGLLAGDDFDHEHEGVKAAVSLFAHHQDIDLTLLTDYNRPPSWFMEKPR